MSTFIKFKFSSQFFINDLGLEAMLSSQNIPGSRFIRLRQGLLKRLNQLNRLKIFFYFCGYNVLLLKLLLRVNNCYRMICEPNYILIARLVSFYLVLFIFS